MSDGAITFERTRAYGVVRSILTDPGTYARMTDDFAPVAADFAVNEHPLAWYVLVIVAGQVDGLFCFYPENAICWAAHVAFLRGVPPRVTHQAGREIVPWLFAHTPCLRLIASVPACNRAAVRFGLRAMGLRAYGRNTNSFLKGGKLVDQILMGRSKPDAQGLS